MRARSRWTAALRTPTGASATVLLAAVLLLAVLAPMLWSDRAAAVDVGQILRGPSATHWLGTDNLGRDVFFRVLVATRLSVVLAVLATAIGVLIGLLLGTAPVLLGRRLGRLVTAVVHAAVAFPGLLLALFFAVIFGVGARGALLAIGLAIAPGFARLAQTLVAGVANRDYVAAARNAGVGRFRVLVRHVLPNIAEPLVVNATITAGGALLAFASLSFLGLGVQPPSYDWGQLLQNGLDGIYEHPLAALAPGVPVVVAGLAFNLFGEAVARAVGAATITGRSFGRRLPPAPVPAAPPAEHDGAVLSVRGLHVSFPGPDGTVVTPVRGVDLTVGRGEVVGIVGESGSGKSLTALAVASLIEPPGRVHADRLEFLGENLLGRPEKELRTLLGTSFAMVFQDPLTSFNPAHRVGPQLAEVARQHLGMTRRQARDRAVDRLRAMRVPAARRRARQFPHEFSGGMRQRAMIGLGMMGSPALIVADEPTTALDVTVQRQVLALLESVRRADSVAILLISHDITVVGQFCDRVLVMYSGQIAEDLPVTALRTDARHPYTRALLAMVPDMTTDRDQPLAVIPGRLPDPADRPAGCAFAPRCPLADDHCRRVEPPLVTAADGRRVACWHAAEPAPADDTPAVRVGERG